MARSCGFCTLAPSSNDGPLWPPLPVATWPLGRSKLYLPRLVFLSQTGFQLCRAISRKRPL